MSQEPFSDDRPYEQWLPRSDLSGVRHLPARRIRALCQAAESLGFACFTVDLREAGLKGALKAFGKQLGFPRWYGVNLDALYDCLTDFSWNEAPGYVIFLTHAGKLHEQGKPFTQINDVLADAILEWRQRGVPFWVFHDLPADGLTSLPLPAPT